MYQRQQIEHHLISTGRAAYGLKMSSEMLGIALFALVVVPVATAQGQEIKVTLLGTGRPPAVMNRFGPSILVEAGGQKFIFDAGPGALQRLNQIKMPWQDVNGVFLTHLHSDHVVGFPDLWLTGWLTRRGGIGHCRSGVREGRSA